MTYTVKTGTRIEHVCDDQREAFEAAFHVMAMYGQVTILCRPKVIH